MPPTYLTRALRFPHAPKVQAGRRSHRQRRVCRDGGTDHGDMLGHEVTDGYEPGRWNRPGSRLRLAGAPVAPNRISTWSCGSRLAIAGREAAVAMRLIADVALAKRAVWETLRQRSRTRRSSGGS